MAYTTPKEVEQIVKRWDECQSHHGRFVKAYERRERAYRGVLDQASSADKWKHRLHPPYAFNLIETIVSNTVEMGLSFSVKPAPKVGVKLDEAMKLIQQADTVEYLLRHEHRVDEMDFKQRPLYLTAAIGGRGVGKSYWNWTEGAVRRQGIKNVPVHDAQGNVALEVPTITEIVEKGVLHDNSTFEVIDPRDFVTHESAKTLQPWEPGGAQYLFHRCWYSKEQLKLWEASGFIKNVDALEETRDFNSEHADREKALWDISRTKDLYEVLEYWCFKDGHPCRTLVGQRKVLLRAEEQSPFWHNDYPFVVCSSMPLPFTTIGMSDIELVEQLQEMLWELGNQTLDNIELINNFITLIGDDVEDPDAFETYPGARWPGRKEQVEVFQPPYQLANVTAQREALIKGDLQNVTSAAPFASGADSATVDNKTATGASIVMNAAQQRLQFKKYQAQQSLRQEANMRIKNCQQFITEERLLHVVGQDGATTFREMTPLDIQGDFLVELTPMGESAMRQERRAEAGAILQQVAAIVPVAVASQVFIDLKQVLLWYFKLSGLEDESLTFFKPDPPVGPMPGQPQPGAPGAPAGAAPPPGAGPNLGTTASTAVDAASPSATGGISMSPQVMLQRSLAMRGGSNNT